MESLIGIFTLTPVTILNVAILWMPAMQCSAVPSNGSCHVTIVSQSSVGGSFFTFVNTCPCKILTVASIPIVCITFSENLTQFSLIINPTIEIFCCFPNAEVTEILLKRLVLSTGLAQRNI